MSDFPVPDLAEVDLARVMRALGDPIRLRIVQVLLDGEAHGKSEQRWDAEVGKSTLSHHYRILREAGLTCTLVEGRTHAIQLRRTELDRRFPGLLDAIAASA